MLHNRGGVSEQLQQIVEIVEDLGCVRVRLDSWCCPCWQSDAARQSSRLAPSPTLRRAAGSLVNKTFHVYLAASRSWEMNKYLNEFGEKFLVGLHILNIE